MPNVSECKCHLTDMKQSVSLVIYLSLWEEDQKKNFNFDRNDNGLTEF